MTDLEICNWALCKLGESPLDSLDDTGHAHALRCKAQLRPLHLSLLRLFDWNFATFTDVLSPLQRGVNHQWLYPLPHLCVRVLNPRTPKFAEGNCIVLPDRRSLTISYIKEVSFAVADPLYCEALACKLAVEMCVRVREAEGLKAFLVQEFDLAWRNAIREANKELQGEAKYYE